MKRSSLSARLALLLAVGALAAAPAAASAAASDDGPRPLRALTSAPLVDLVGGTVRDERRETPTRALASAAQATPAKTYFTRDGYAIPVEVSDAYTAGAPAVQSFVDYLGGLLHGPELGRLRLFIAPPGEIPELCGGDEEILACYIERGARMVIPGEPGADSTISNEHVIAHEYGHHVAAFRENEPFAASDVGPKYWSSYERVCDGIFDRRYFLRGEGRRYRSDPGENWAEVYARLHLPNDPWTFDPSLRPGAGALAAARRDVLQPWTGPRTRTFRGSLGSGNASDRFTFRLRLDGAMRIRLSGPSRANYDLSVSASGRNEGRTRRRGSRDSITFEAACRNRPSETLAVSVLRRSGSGRFTLRVTYPG